MRYNTRLGAQKWNIMTWFYQPDLSEDIDSPFARDGADKLVRRSNWLDMNDRTIVVVMVTRNVPVAVEIGRQASIASGH